MHWGHCTFYFKARKLEKVIEFDNILQKVKKYNVQKNSGVDIFLYKLKNVLYNLRNAWRFNFPENHKLIFSCITMVSDNCFTSVVHGVDQLLAPVNRYCSPGQLYYVPQFLCISWFCLMNSIFYVSPQVFYGIKVRGLCWPLHYLNSVCLKPWFCSLAGVFGVIVLLKHPFQGHFLFRIRQHDFFQ